MIAPLFSLHTLVFSRLARWSPWRLRRCLRAGFLLPGLVWSTQALAGVIWVALSSKDPAYLETANALRSALPDDEVRVGEWRDFKSKTSSPQVLVTVGSEALRQLQGLSERSPVIALLIPRSTLDELRDIAGGRISGVYYEQPIPRQANLLRTAFPDKTRVGVLLGPASVRYRSELALALQRAGMEGIFEVIQDKNDLAEAAKNVLDSAEIFLALPDGDAINNQSARFILLSSYRRGVPVVGYSASFVKAGAALAMVSSPTQIGKEAALMVQETLPGRRMPAPRAPAEFDVLVNTSVSRSLGLGLDAPLLEKRMRGEETPR